jgi:alkaline phosphatase D
MNKWTFFCAAVWLLCVPSWSQTSFRLGFGSCADYQGERSDSIFKTIQSQPAMDAFLWLGDNFYYTKTDLISPKKMKSAAFGRFSHPEVAQFRSSMPQWAIWDDHDFGPNDADSSFVFKAKSQQIFTQLWKDTPIDLKRNGDLRWSKRVGNVLVVGLDDRSHRGPVGTQILGRSQLNWLEDVLNAHSDARLVLIALGSQVLNAAPVFENYVRYPERDDFLAVLEAAKQKNVVVLTGDRHHSETNRLVMPSGKEIVEYTSSALSSKLFAPTAKEVQENKCLDPESIVTAFTFGWLELTSDNQLEVKYVGKKGEVLWSEVRQLQ